MSVPDPALWASAVAVVVATVCGVGVLGLWTSTRSRRITADAATMDLRPETPALVDLLTGGFEVEDDAVPATAIDLAARGYYDIEEYGDDVVFRLRSGPGEQLTAYEDRVLRHIRNHTHDGVVPAAVLTIGPDGVSERWFKGFTREVTKHGRSQGLCRRRFGFRQLAVAVALTAAAFVPALVVSSTAPRTDEPTGWGSVGNAVLGLAFLVALGIGVLTGRLVRTDSQADTLVGRVVAAHWLGVRDFYRTSGRFEDKPAASVAVWNRHLAYATAMGLAPVVQRQLPFETEHDRHAWSRATGQWRRVKVRYQAFRPAWGEHPGRVAFGGLIQAVGFGAFSYLALQLARSEDQLTTLDADQRRWVSLGALVVGLLLVVAAVYGAVKLVIGVADLIPRRTVEGEVVRRRRFRQGHRLPKPVQWLIWSGRDQHGQDRDMTRRTRYHLAVDDGTEDRVLARTVRSEIHAQAPQGARVRMRVSPLLGYVSTIEVLAAPRRSAANEPAVVHPVVEEGLTAAAATATLQLDQALQRVGELTDDQGRNVLEQTDEDGVTLEEQLAEGRLRVDELRADPRIAGSPIASALDALGAAIDPTRAGPPDGASTTPVAGSDDAEPRPD